jgi:hypothetical protein
VTGCDARACCEYEVAWTFYACAALLRIETFLRSRSITHTLTYPTSRPWIHSNRAWHVRQRLGPLTYLPARLAAAACAGNAPDARAAMAEIGTPKRATSAEGSDSSLPSSRSASSRVICTIQHTSSGRQSGSLGQWTCERGRQASWLFTAGGYREQRPLRLWFGMLSPYLARQVSEPRLVTATSSTARNDVSDHI